jgi:signal transduction histidine kinase
MTTAETKGRVLVVDDDLLNRIKLSTNLEEAGYSVALAKDGAEALEAMRTEPYDTMLLDLMMPVMDGFEVLQHVAADSSLQHIPIIVVSAEEDLESVVRCIEMGAADHLPKPFNPTVLRARVGACVGKKRSHDREVALFNELQQRYRELEDLQKLRDDLTHMIVHDLRTPLTSFLTGLQSVPMMGALNPDQSECLAMATDGGTDLLGMINELLDISKMEDGSLQLDLKPVEPPAVVERALSQLEHLGHDKELTLQREIAPALPALQADEEKLIRVLVNLCGNAIKFTPARGSITVRVHPAAFAASANGPVETSGNGIVFSVTDTGEGIPPAYFERIFEKFGQVETRKSGQKMSTGLGLTFCKMAVEKHGGRIWVESEPGRGSTFSFSLPAWS